MSNLSARSAVLLAALAPTLVFGNGLREAVSALSDAVLETSFWACDFQATRVGFGSEGATCEAITDELKRRKFGDSFEEFLAWWKQNKSAAHAQLDVVQKPTLVGKRSPAL